MRNIIKTFVLGLFISYSIHTQAQQTCPANHASEFAIELIRIGIDEISDQGQRVSRIFGDIGLNNQNIGRFYENPETKIAPGIYKGVLRYESNHNFVLSNCGEVSTKGDFLLEVSGVEAENGSSRSAILFHPGFKPSHSKGCVLMGARKRSKDGSLLPLDQNDPLVRLRKEFYGTDNPISCPNKRITITVKDFS